MSRAISPSRFSSGGEARMGLRIAPEGQPHAPDLPLDVLRARIERLVPRRLREGLHQEAVRQGRLLLGTPETEAVGIERDLQTRTPEVCESLWHVVPEAGAAEGPQDSPGRAEPPRGVGGYGGQPLPG